MKNRPARPQDYSAYIISFDLMNSFSKISREVAAVIGALAFAFTPALALAHSDKVDVNAKGDAHVLLPSLSKGVLIDADGNVLVSGAKVNSVSGNTVTASSIWGSLTLPWTVHTSSSTKYAEASGSADIKVGDTISFMGVLDSTSSVFSVMAKAVRDWTHVVAKATVHGTITSIDASNKSFVVKTPEKGSFTINTNSDTTIKKSSDELTLSQLTVGDSVTVSGSTSNATIIAATKVKVTERASASEPTRKFWTNIWAHLNFGLGKDNNDNDKDKKKHDDNDD